MNSVNLVGRITHDLDLKKTGEHTYARFSLAVNRYNDEVDFIDCVAWNKQAEALVKFMTKGSRIGVEGRIQVGSYENKEGVKIKTTDVVVSQVHFLESKKEAKERTEEGKPLPF